MIYKVTLMAKYTKLKWKRAKRSFKQNTKPLFRNPHPQSLHP